MSIQRIVFVCTFSVCSLVDSREAEKPVERAHQIKVGNFSVVGSMQPGPLLGFGQNIVNQYDTLVVVNPDWFLGPRKNFTEILPYLVYGMRDDLSITWAFPVAARFKEDGLRSSGSEDLSVQLEYAFHATHEPTVTNQMTFVGAMYFPSGDECKVPPTGFGSPSFFLGFTAAHLTPTWFYYISSGGLITTKEDGNKSGSQFFYQAGVGRNIAYSPNKWILAWMLEMNGWYEQRTRLNGILERDSGFHLIELGPSLWFSTNRVIVQFGVAPFPMQHLFGHQFKNSVFISLSVGVRFNLS